ncbi:MAG TPA: transcription termination factor NusA [Patescibacteria group bacterium]|nr:transcription termination factor NusA [Patescibacteria group bacterium]
MPAIQRSEFALALNQVSTERGIDPSIVLETVRNAILAAYRKDHPEATIEEFTAELNSNTGEAKILHDGKDVTPPGFGRIAAQTAKQVILQKIREKEKEAILSDYRLRIGTIVNGMVLRFAGPNIIIDVGKTEAIMLPQDQIPNERYHLNQRIVVYLLEIKEGLKGEEIYVSRTHNGLLEGLFKREVPEVSQGSVEIKAIVREPGNRSKVAVYSNQSGIDPVGSCVGQKGVRVQAIIQEFGGLEKIDIIQWHDDPKGYVAASLSPAKQVKVEIDEDKKTANVKVAGDELSLAIGKDGQNVRLASKLTGYRIEIEEDPDLPPTPRPEPKPIEEVKAEAVAEVVKVEEATDETPSGVQTQPEPVQAAPTPPPTDEKPEELLADDSKLPKEEAEPQTQEGPVEETADKDQTDETNSTDKTS